MDIADSHMQGCANLGYIGNAVSNIGKENSHDLVRVGRLLLDCGGVCDIFSVCIAEQITALALYCATHGSGIIVMDEIIAKLDDLAVCLVTRCCISDEDKNASLCLGLVWRVRRVNDVHGVCFLWVQQ